MHKKIRKAVFPVAGPPDTRFLPATNVSPKERLSIIDKPLIRYAVEEAIAAGITEMAFVTGCNKRVIEGIRCKFGNKIGCLQATMRFALRHPEVMEKFHAFLQSLPFAQLAPSRSVAKIFPAKAAIC